MLRHLPNLICVLRILLVVPTVQALTRGGVVCVPILIGRGQRPAGAPGHWLESGHIARDLKRLPGRLCAVS